MQPDQPTEAGRRADGFKPKYRHFHPLDRVWVKNPFDHDVVFYVADEYNQKFKYRLDAGKISELPGGSIATLGVKAIVDEMIQNNPDDAPRLYDLPVRAKHEKEVIRQVKTTALRSDSANPGEINLTAQSNDVPEVDESTPAEEPEEAFPGLNQPQGQPQAMPSAPLPAPAAEGIGNLVAASLPPTDVVVGANNAGHRDE